MTFSSGSKCLYDVLLIADPHVHPFQAFGRVGPGGVHSRVASTLEAMEKAFQYAKDNKIKHVVLLGDIFHGKGVVRGGVFNLVYRFLKKWSECISTITVIPGNHDLDAEYGGESVLEPLSSIVTVVRPEEGAWVGLHNDSDPNKYFPVLTAYVPWGASIPSEEVLRQWSASVRICFAHAAVNGAVVGLGEHCPKTQLSVSDFDPFTLSFLGHYHKHQALGGGRVVYVGSLLGQSFSDAGKVGGFVRLRVVADGDNYQPEWEFIPTAAPRFIVVEEKAPGSFSYPHYAANCYVRYDGERSEEEEQVRKAYLDAGALGIVFKWADRTKDFKPRIQMDVGRDTSVPLQQYIELMNTSLDANRLLALGRDIMDTVDNRRV